MENNKIRMGSMRGENALLLPLRGNSNFWEDANYRIRWEGLVFINGIPTENESFIVFIKELQNIGIKAACRLLKGIFFLLVEDKVSGNIYAFVDNSGIFQAFYTEKIISTSFLELVKHEGYTYKDLEPESVVEFLHRGNIYSNKTFFKPIKKFPWDKIFHLLPQERKIQILQKDISNFYDDSEKESKSFTETFEGLAVSLSNRKVSLDLTGGFDSRLIVAMLDFYDLDFEIDISGMENNKDVIISREVARALGHPWYCTYHSISTLEEDINELFYITEGLEDILCHHRVLQLLKARRARGIDTMITGCAGGLIKDFWWLQDFPFYSKQSANLERLVNYRIMQIEPDHFILNDKLFEKSITLRNRIIRDLSQYILSTNTRTYDNVYLNFQLRETIGRFQTTNSCFLKSYVPFVDLDMARIGYNLPRSTRFFNMFHRKNLTNINPLVAKIPTTEGGISASSEPMMITRDLFKYMVDKVNRLTIKLKQRKLNINATNSESPNHPNLYHHAREMRIMRDSLEILKDIGIVDKAIKLEQVGNRYLGRLLSLGLLVKFIMSKR